MEKWEQFWKILSPILKLAEIGLLVFGAFLAYQALGVYRAQTAVASVNRLDDGDTKLNQMQLDFPYLAAFYAELRSSLAPREQADIYLALLAECGHPKNKPCSAIQGSLPNWRTIPDLACAIYDDADFNSDVKKKLRAGYIFAETMLYLVARAYERKTDITQEEYDTWAAYIKNNGHHPLLLSAIHFGFIQGYISKPFWAELQRLLSPAINQRASKMIEVIYPQFGTAELSSMAGKNSCA